MKSFLNGLSQVVTYVEKQTTKAVLHFEFGHDQVRAELRKQINAQFLSIGVNMLKAQAALAKEPTMQALLATCDKLQYQADALQRFLLANEEIEVLTQILVIYGKEYGSFEDLKPKLTSSPAIQEVKILLQSLLSMEIYNSLLPLAEQLGSFDKLQLSEQQRIVDILKSEAALTKVKELDLTVTFTSLKKSMVTLAAEFKLDPSHSAQLTLMVEKIEKAHLSKLTDIKKETETHLPQLQQKLLDIIYATCPHLKIEIEKPKEIMVQKENKTEQAKRKNEKEDDTSRNKKVCVSRKN